MIELRLIRRFMAVMAVAEELNFSRAAEYVHIDQTPLSRAVRDLEEQLVVALFVRAARSLRFTPVGARLHEETRKLFVRIERVKRVVRETDARYQSPLRIAVADGIAQTRLTQCLTSWRATEPQTPLEIVEVLASELRAVAMDSLRQSNVLKVPVLEEIHITTCALHMRQRSGLALPRSAGESIVLHVGSGAAGLRSCGDSKEMVTSRMRARRQLMEASGAQPECFRSGISAAGCPCSWWSPARQRREHLVLGPIFRCDESLISRASKGLYVRRGEAPGERCSR